VYEFLQSDGRKEVMDNRLPTCYKDGSVTHYISLARAKSRASQHSYTMLPNAAYYSLSNYGSHLDSEFVRQFDYTETCCPSGRYHSPHIAAALLAFQDNDRFAEKYFTQLDDGGFELNGRFAPSGKHLMLPAALGLSTLRKFNMEQIDISILERVVSMGIDIGRGIAIDGISAAPWQHFFARLTIWMLSRIHTGKECCEIRETSRLGQELSNALLRVMAVTSGCSGGFKFSSSGSCEGDRPCFRHAWMRFVHSLPKDLVRFCKARIRPVSNALQRSSPDYEHFDRQRCVS
jgi:hypothetical protein